MLLAWDTLAFVFCSCNSDALNNLVRQSATPILFNCRVKNRIALNFGTFEINSDSKSEQF